MAEQDGSIAFLYSKSNDWIVKYLINASFEEVWTGPISFYEDKRHVSGHEMVFILGYMKILDKRFLSQNNLNLVVHESALPYGKGFSPVQWQILSGLNDITVTLFEASDSVDSGDIILQDKLIFNGSELYEEIREKQAAVTISVIKKMLKQFPGFRKQKQSGEETVFPRRKPQDGELCIDKTIREQFNLLRIGNNEEWPSFFCHRNTKYILRIYKDNDED